MFYRKVLRIPWTKHIRKHKEEVLKITGTRKTYLNSEIVKISMTNYEDLENVILTRYTEERRARGKQKVTYQMSLFKWIAEQG